jgi:hypothetical protein
MKIRVTVQNGANHGLSRDEVESMLAIVPSSWGQNVTLVALNGHQEPNVRCTYHPKEKVLGLFWPQGVQREPPSKAKAVEQLLLALSVISERGELPDRISTSMRQEHLGAIGDVRSKCLAAIGAHAT